MEASKRLCKAIQEANLEDVKQCLKEGADPLMRIDYDTYFTPWNWLYSCRHLLITELLLKEREAVNYQIPELCDETLIFGAILFKDKPKIRLLVEEGADINIINENGYTPLYYTIEQSQGCRDLIPLLLELGADVSVGCEKVKEFDQESEGMKDFYSHIVQLLDDLDDNADFRSLRTHTNRLLELHETNPLPQDLLEKIEEIRDVYELDRNPPTRDQENGVNTEKDDASFKNKEQENEINIKLEDSSLKSKDQENQNQKQNKGTYDFLMGTQENGLNQMEELGPDNAETEQNETYNVDTQQKKQAFHLENKTSGIGTNIENSNIITELAWTTETATVEGMDEGQTKDDTAFSIPQKLQKAEPGESKEVRSQNSNGEPKEGKKKFCSLWIKNIPESVKDDIFKVIRKNGYDIQPKAKNIVKEMHEPLIPLIEIVLPEIKKGHAEQTKKEMKSQTSTKIQNQCLTREFEAIQKIKDFLHAIHPSNLGVTQLPASNQTLPSNINHKADGKSPIRLSGEEIRKSINSLYSEIDQEIDRMKKDIAKKYKEEKNGFEMLLIPESSPKIDAESRKNKEKVLYSFYICPKMTTKKRIK